MKEVNGVKIFSDGERPDILKGLTSNFDIRCPFGMKITEEDGKKILTALTQEQGLKITRQANLPDPEVNEIGVVKCWTGLSCHPNGCKCKCDLYLLPTGEVVCVCPKGC